MRSTALGAALVSQMTGHPQDTGGRCRAGCNAGREGAKNDQEKRPARGRA